MQNAGLATVLSARHFPAMPESAIASAAACVWHSISGALLAGLFNKMDSIMEKEWDFARVRRELRKGNRVLMFVRHSERPHIRKDDPTFGDTLPLTENGFRMSVEFGEKLRGATDDVQFLASPLRRTVMTAEGIAQGMEIANADIPTDERIGNSSAFIADVQEVWRLFSDGDFFNKMIRYTNDGEQSGFAPIKPAADAFENHALSQFKGKLGIFTTHDVYLVSYLRARGVVTDWSEDNWTRFLDAAVISISPDGRRKYAFFRAGLSEHVSGVDVGAKA
jgi:hypothetical protein